MKYGLLVGFIIALSGAVPSQAGVSPGCWAHYQLASVTEITGNEQHPHVSEVTLLAGPREVVDGAEYRWWEAQVTKRSGEKFAFRVLSEGIPMTEGDRPAIPGKVVRYILKEGDAQPVEYVHARTGLAYLPEFDFRGSMCPASGEFAAQQGGFATVGTYLGHMLNLVRTGDSLEWPSWPDPLTLRLNPDLLIYRYGMSKDTDDRYITTFNESSNYTYVPLTREDVDELLSLGMSGWMVNDEQEEWVRLKPVFYYKATWSASVGLKYPETLYRSNYRGATDFIDEPAHHMAKTLRSIKRPEQAAHLMLQHVQENWNRPSGTRHWTSLRDHLRARNVNLGTFNIVDDDYPIWETVPETSFYQLMAGPTGILHEGRWQLRETNAHFARLLGKDVDLSVDEMLKLYYADLRGAARAFGDSWGTSIYGQCDPEVAPRALTLAYDMGARHLWFWTFDKEHHLPYFMTKKLLRHLQEHVEANPRPPLDEMLHAPRTVIVLPYGYQALKRSSDVMWGGIHIHSPNSAGVTHEEVIVAAIGEALAAMRSGEDFDFAVEVGQDFEGYSRVVKVGLDAHVHDSTDDTRPKRLNATSLRSSRFDAGRFGDAAARIRIPYRSAIAVDGDLGEWEAADWLILDRKEQYRPCPVFPDRAGPWDGPGDLSVHLTFARDENYLYVAAKVRDNVYHQRQADANIWQGDGIEVALDFDLHRSAREVDSQRSWVDAFGAVTAAPRYVELAIANTPNGPQVYMGRCPRGTTPRLIGNAKLAVEHGADNETIYETAIPWSVVSPFPAHFSRLGSLSFIVNDSDEGNRKGFLELTPGIGTEKDPARFALVEFEPIPTDKAHDISVLESGARQILTEAGTLSISIDSMSNSEKKACLTVALRRARHAAASGAFDLQLSRGRNRVTAELDISSVKPGAYVCESELRDAGDGALIAQSSFQVLILVDSKD